MLTEYLAAALRKAEYKKLEDGSWFAEIPGFKGYGRTEQVSNLAGMS